MKKKKLRSVIAILLALTLFVSLSSTVLARSLLPFNSLSGAKLIAQTDETEQQMPGTSETPPPAEAEDETVTVKNGEVYIGADKTVDKTIRSTGATVFAGFTDYFLKTITGMDFKTIGIWTAIFGKEDDGVYRQLSEIKEQLDLIAAKLDNISAQIDQATKEILGAIEKTDMINTLKNCNNLANNLKNNYYLQSVNDTTLPYLTALNDGQYADPEQRGKIDNWLHEVYSYTNDVISPVTKNNYKKSNNENFVKELLSFGNQLTGEMPLMIQRDIFTLYYGIATYTFNFDIETIDSRNALNQNAFNFYEKGYATLFTAIKYDREIHQAYLTEKRNIIKILEAAKGNMSADDQKVIDNEIQRMRNDNIDHQAAVDRADVYLKALQEQYDKLKTAFDNAQSRLEGDMNLNLRNRVYCYRNDAYYYKTVLIQDCNYGFEEAFKSKNLRNFVDCRMSGHDPETFISIDTILAPFDKEDRLRTDKLFAKAAPVADLESLKTWAENRHTTLRDELIGYFDYTESADKDYAGGKALSSYVKEDQDIGVYINGWQKTFEEQNGKSCEGKQPYRVITRNLRQLNDQNVFTESETMRKRWIGGGTYDRMTDINQNTVQKFPMIILLKDDEMHIGGNDEPGIDKPDPPVEPPIKDIPTEPESTIKTENIQTGVEMFDMTAAVVSGVLILLAGFMIFLVAGKRKSN